MIGTRFLIVPNPRAVTAANRVLSTRRLEVEFPVGSEPLEMLEDDRQLHRVAEAEREMDQNSGHRSFSFFDLTIPHRQ